MFICKHCERTIPERWREEKNVDVCGECIDLEEDEVTEVQSSIDNWNDETQSHTDRWVNGVKETSDSWYNAVSDKDDDE